MSQNYIQGIPLRLVRLDHADFINKVILAPMLNPKSSLMFV